MQFDWDPEKARKNLVKHGISFEEAQQVFDDPLFLTFADLDHSFQERRFIIMGELPDGRLLVVSYTDHWQHHPTNQRSTRHSPRTQNL